MSSYRKNYNKSEMSVNDTSNNVPVLQQINSLNSQPIMQVRRPSDLNSSFTPVDSQHSTHNIQKSPLCTSGVLDGRTTPLNLINEESSVNEQSDNKAFENLINKKPLPQILDFIIKEPVHWSQIFTHSCTHKNNDQFTKFGSYLGDKAYTQQNIQQDLQFNIKPAIIIIQVIIYFYFLYQFPLLLYGLAYEDYNLIYQAQIQASFLILNLILFVLNFHKTSQYLDYMPLATLIPFICAFTDINQKLIFVQIIHLVAFIRFYQVFKQLLQVSICLRQYSIYFFAVRISQIHLFQIICGFLIVITSKVNQNQLGLNEFYQNYCSLINILIISYNQSFLVYPIKMTVFIFIIYQYAIIVDQINYLCKDQNTLISGLNELSKLIKSLPFDLRYESLLISNSQIQSRLKTRNLIDYDKLPILLSYKLLNEQYSKILRKLPLIDKCLSNTTIINVLMNATKERIIESNEILIEAQKENKFLYFVLSGKVKCYQQRNNQSFQIANNENEIYNQYGFFLDQQSEVVVQSDTCCKVLEINSELFWKEVKKSISEHQKVKMFLDRVQYNQEYKLIGVSCQICQGNHKIDNCKKIHYVPSRQMLMNYIYFDEINKRQKFQRRNHTRKFRCIKNNGMIEQIVCNFRHLMLPQSDTFKRPKTITSIGMQLEQLSQHSDEEEIHKMSQQVQNLSPVQYVPQVGSSASSYVLKELKQAQQLKSSKNSFMVHQKRYQEKRQSHVTRVERDLSPSIIKYATIQDKKSQRSKSIISEDYANGVVHSSDHRQFSKYGIQSSKFTNETAKQFMNNPFDMPLYDLNLSIDNNHSYSDYYPRNNIDQALISYRQYQDSIISNKSKQNT